MIFIVNLCCPNGHHVCGEAFEYASELPPEAWFETMSRDFLRQVEKTPGEFSCCASCGARYSGETRGEWAIKMHRMHAQTMAEAHQALRSGGAICGTVNRPGAV